MKNKIVVLFTSLALIFNISFSASSVGEQQLPNWIDVEYSDLNNEAVSEYQLVTVTVKNHGLWFTHNNYDVSVDYDPTQLNLVNTVFSNSLGDKATQIGSLVSTDSNNFEVSYQFYMQPNVDVESIPLTITKVENDKKTTSQIINLKAMSNTTMSNIRFGNINLGYAVTKYTNDDSNIEYNAHFKVISNPNNEEFTLSLKKNTMSVSSSDIYKTKLRFTSGSAVALDKNNFSINMKTGDEFDLNITSSVAGLSAKDDAINFFIYVQSSDGFTRISPKFYPSELITNSINTHLHRYALIKVAIMLFFTFLGLLLLISGKRDKSNKK